MIIAVDFDGTICRGTYPSIEGSQPYAVETLKKLHDDGHYIIIWTCRSGEKLTEAINWMLENGIPFNRVNAHNPENLKLYGDDSRKVYAHVYVDDKQVYGLPPWPDIYQYITEKEQEYQMSKN